MKAVIAASLAASLLLAAAAAARPPASVTTDCGNDSDLTFTAQAPLKAKQKGSTVTLVRVARDHDLHSGAASSEDGRIAWTIYVGDLDMAADVAGFFAAWAWPYPSVSVAGGQTGSGVPCAGTWTLT